MKTYKGSDIDTVEIRHDAEGSSAKTYNYRVVMVKGDAEMDMRGIPVNFKLSIICKIR